VDTFLIQPNAYPAKILEKGCPTWPDNRECTAVQIDCNVLLTAGIPFGAASGFCFSSHCSNASSISLYFKCTLWLFDKSLATHVKVDLFVHILNEKFSNVFLQLNLSSSAAARGRSPTPVKKSCGVPAISKRNR